MIDESLKDLEIIKDIDVRSDEVNITLALPFPEIPIKEEIIWSIKESLINITDKIKIRETLMNKLERQKFFNMERKSWKEMGL
jgi:metal-sulfur cluster biosynthetic enzyme